LLSAQIQYAALDAATPVHILDYFTAIDFTPQPSGLPLSLDTLLQNVSTMCCCERFPHLGLSGVGILFDGVCDTLATYICFTSDFWCTETVPDGGFQPEVQYLPGLWRRRAHYAHRRRQRDR
jgi:hypothetical protein